MLLDGRLKLRHLVLAVAIADHGSVVRAAENLHITQPVVTRGLRDLEKILHVELFHRGPRGMELTVYGEAFLGHARAVLTEVRLAEQQLAELVDGKRGTVTVGTHLAGSNLLPKAIATLKQSRPNVTIIVREGTPDVLLAALRTGDVDLIVGRLTADEVLPDTQRLTLYAEPIRVVTRRDHPAQRLTDPGLEQLRDFPWVLPVQQTFLRHELEQAFYRRGLPLPDNRIECTALLTLRTLIVETDVVATLPFFIAAADPELEVLTTPLEGITRPVGVTMRSDRPASPSARQLLDHLHAAARSIRAQLRIDEPSPD